MTHLAQRLMRPAALACLALSGLMACATEVETDDQLAKDQAELGDDCVPADAEPCETADGAEGVSICFEDEEDGLTYWGECEVSTSAGSTPLVLSFDGGSVSYDTTMTGAFDLTGRGQSMATDWPAARTPWLAMDRDGDGRIESGAELFGSATMLSSGSLAENGFVALRELDDNADGRITSADAAWSRLLVWTDADADRSSDGSELTSIAQHGIVSIDLGYVVDRRCDARGNCEVERASFAFRDAHGHTRSAAIVDVHLAHHTR